LPDAAGAAEPEGELAPPGFHRVRLIVEANNIIGNVDLTGAIDYRHSLRGDVQHDHIAMLAGVTVDHIEHFSPNIFGDVALRGSLFLIQLILLALELTGQELALALQSGLLNRGRPLIIREAILQLLNLFLHILQIVLLGGELTLKLC
jgi:hypothetical protein